MFERHAVRQKRSERNEGADEMKHSNVEFAQNSEHGIRFTRIFLKEKYNGIGNESDEFVEIKVWIF